MFRIAISSWRLAFDGWRESRCAPPPTSTSPPRATNHQLPTGQEGYTLAALILILTIIAIVTAYTVPEQWSLVMKRDRDRQTIFLMRQFARAILAWQQKHTSLPASLEQIQEARSPRLIRGTGKWPCPITGNQDDWILVPPGAVQGGGAAPTGTRPPGDPVLGRDAGSTPQSGQLNPAASPDDYVGPFIGVRPKAKGGSFIALNGAENYEEWVYTVYDLAKEIAARNQPQLH